MLSSSSTFEILSVAPCLQSSAFGAQCAQYRTARPGSKGLPEDVITICEIAGRLGAVSLGGGRSYYERNV